MSAAFTSPAPPALRAAAMLLALLGPSAGLGAEPAESTPFPVPPSLVSAVTFWEEIFVRHDRATVVLHDREAMEVVWQVLDLPTDEDGEILEEEVDATIRAASDGLRKRLRHLDRGGEPRDAEDQILIALVGGDRTRLAGAWQRVRAQRGVADAFREGLERSRALLPTLQRVLAEEAVPAQIAALPFVESMFNPEARSSVGARGLWQLMPATARGLGLKVTNGTDERLDAEKATRAAARMLHKNYAMLGSWPLAITAYNHGPYGVRRAVEAVGTSDLAELIDRYRKSSWGFASKNFYAEFLAAVRVFARQDQNFAALTGAPAVAVAPDPTAAE